MAEPTSNCADVLNLYTSSGQTVEFDIVSATSMDCDDEETFRQATQQLMQTRHLGQHDDDDCTTDDETCKVAISMMH